MQPRPMFPKGSRMLPGSAEMAWLARAYLVSGNFRATIQMQRGGQHAQHGIHACGTLVYAIHEMSAGCTLASFKAACTRPMTYSCAAAAAAVE